MKKTKYWTINKDTQEKEFTTSNGETYQITLTQSRINQIVLDTIKVIKKQHKEEIEFLTYKKASNYE